MFVDPVLRLIHIISLECGHVFCAQCLLTAALTNVALYRPVACQVCRTVITREPILGYDIQDRVEAMAKDLGLAIPPRRPFHWPAELTDRW